MLLDELATSFSKFAHSSKIKLPQWTTILWWSVGIIILTSLTLRDIGPLVDQYHNNNVAPKVRVIAGNLTIKPPPMTFCIPRTWFALQGMAEHLYASARGDSNVSVCVECEQMANQSWDVWTNLDLSHYGTVRELHQALSAALSKKLISEGNLAVLSLNNSRWNRPILDAAWDLLDCIANLDSSVADSSENECWGDHDVSMALSARKLEYIYSRIMDILCIHLKFRFREASCQRILAGTPGVVFLNLLCLQLPMIQNGSHLQFFSVMGNYTWPAAVRGLDPFYVDEETNMLTWPLTEGDMLFISDPTNPALPADERAFLKYFVVLTVAEKRQDKPCYTESGPVVCKGNCIVAKIVEQCQCIPFTFRKDVQGDRNFSFCTPAHYASCNFNKPLEQENCEERCDNPCEYAAYHWHVTRAIVPPRYRYNHRLFSLNVSPLLSPFVEFTVDKKETPEQFFSQVAAIFNLYLGVSGLSVIAILVGCTELLKTWYRSRRHGSGQINRQISVINMQKQESQIDGISQCGLTRVSLGTRQSLPLGLTDREPSKDVEALKRKLDEATKRNSRLKQQVDSQEKTLLELTAVMDRLKKSQMQY